MSKIFKNMLPYWKGLIIVVALLVVQAWCDLSLPAYTSDIIDVGIQNKGVEHVLPEAVTEDEFTLAQLFMTDEEKKSWENSYEKDGDVYRLTVTDKKQLDELDENIYLSDFHAAKGNSEQVVELVFERKLLRPGGLLIFEHSKERSFEGHPALLQVRTYGSVHFSVFRMPDVE